MVSERRLQHIVVPVARLIFAGMFAMAFTFKVIGLQSTAHYIAAAGFPIPLMLAALAASLELGLVLCFLTGAFFREAALAAVIYVLFLAFAFHGPASWTGNEMQPDAIGWNTDKVAAADAPKTWNDLSDPKYKKYAIGVDPDAWIVLLAYAQDKYGGDKGKAEDVFKAIASTNKVAGDLAMRARAELVRLERVEPDGVRVILSADGDKATVLELVGAPAGTGWRFVKAGGTWQALVCLPEAKGAARAAFADRPQDPRSYVS